MTIRKYTAEFRAEAVKQVTERGQRPASRAALIELPRREFSGGAKSLQSQRDYFFCFFPFSVMYLLNVSSETPYQCLPAGGDQRIPLGFTRT